MHRATCWPTSGRGWLRLAGQVAVVLALLTEAVIVLAMIG